MSKILRQLKAKQSSLTEQDIDDWVLPGLMEHYDAKIKSLAYYVYRHQNEAVSKTNIDAFKAKAEQELGKALRTFYFKKEHWKNNRDVNPYLRTCLNYLSKRSYWNNRAGEKMTTPICPACKEKGCKEPCVLESGLLKCAVCSKQSDRLYKEMEKVEKDSKEYTELLTSYNFYSMFSFHSRKGKKCIVCKRFVPNSIINKIHMCPYEDCWYAGDFSDAKEGKHPVGIYARPLMSIDSATSNDYEKTFSFHNVLADESPTAHDHLEMRERINNEKKLLDDVINLQIKALNRNCSSGTKVQKRLMYQAFKNIIERYPEEMISYLVHLKQSTDLPLQAIIFQEYVRLMEDYLPFTLTKGGKKYEIFSLTDPNLALFLGESIYQAQVEEDFTIPNLTKEEYIGNRGFKNYGPCFLGKIINITNLETKESILHEMESYSFIKINMSQRVKPRTPVEVKHFRILPHYEMHSMVYLQRIRRHIVDKTYYRLHKKKRKVARNRI